MQSDNSRNEKKNFGDTFFDSTTYLAFHIGLCVWSIFWTPSHLVTSNLSTDLDSLGQSKGFKTICKVMESEMKKNIIGGTFFNSTTYLAFHVCLCVWSTFWPPFHQAISNLSTDLDSLGQGKDFKAICKVIISEMKKKILETPFLILLPT